MRAPSIIALGLLAGCGPQALSLPADPNDRAATCGVVAAAEARIGTDVTAELSFPAQTRIIHHALLAGADGEVFAPDRATAVSRRMAELQEDIVAGKWQALAPACSDAFPAASARSVSLPADRLEAQLGCDELADFTTEALTGQGVAYDRELGELASLNRTLDRTIGPALRARAGAEIDAQQAMRGRALAGIAEAGPLAGILTECRRRFDG